MLGLNSYRFLWKAPNFCKTLINTTTLFVDLLKNLIDMLYLYLHNVAKGGAFAVEMYDFQGSIMMSHWGHACLDQ